MVAAGNATLGEGFLSRIIDEAGAFSDPAQQIQHVVMRTREHVGSEKPMNISATPWDQLVLARLGKNLAPWERLMIASALGDVGDAGETEIRGGGSKGAAYTRELAGGDVLKSLVGQGYSREHAMGAIAFAHEMGTSEEMAHKFVKIGKEGQDKVKAFVEGLDPNLSEKEKKKAMAEFRRKNPKEGKHLSEEDLLKIQRDHHKKQIELRGKQSALDAQQNLAAENEQSGVENRVTAQSQQDVATRNGRAEVRVATIDEWDALDSQGTTTAPKPPTSTPSQASKNAGVGSENSSQQPKPPGERQATTPAMATPKVG